ncbi:MAG: hypothetical protein CM15mV128_290 [Caudoviricetes sp.]|nr:MAG: hypothetical protein CM15mV128_290 [Caudoviricetes sp.]
MIKYFFKKIFWDYMEKIYFGEPKKIKKKILKKICKNVFKKSQNCDV